jgi:2',3'-cyclic-nucleotide 2'-phosphodiesterase
MRILFIGDTVAAAGLAIVHQYLKPLQEELAVDLTILNCENTAVGNGVTPRIADQLLDWGVDVLTSGNHIWNKKEILPYLNQNTRILRPANYPSDNPGRGTAIIKMRSGEEIAVMNLQGRVFMPANVDDPFRVADAQLSQLPAHIKVIFVDMHAEATAEKIALGWYLDGRVSAVVGTHTHVVTADETILPNGTAYLTDAGMTGPFFSVLGVVKEDVIRRFLTQRPERFEPASQDSRLNAVLVDVDSETGKARSIERIRRG